jgi:putative restriction endonuclease
MCSRRDYYLDLFSRLRTHTNRGVWPSATLYRAPYKPFLLLAVLVQLNRGAIHRNFIEPSPDLERVYKEFCSLIPRAKAAKNMASSFLALRNSGFWRLAPRADKEYDVPYTGSSIHRLRSLFFGARFDADLFPLLQMKSHRNRFTDTLAHNYFAPVKRHEIRQLTDMSPLL